MIGMDACQPQAGLDATTRRRRFVAKQSSVKRSRPFYSSAPSKINSICPSVRGFEKCQPFVFAPRAKWLIRNILALATLQELISGRLWRDANEFTSKELGPKALSPSTALKTFPR